MIMRSWNILFICLLTAAVSLASKTVAAATPAQFHLLGRRHMRDLRIPPSQVDADQKIKAAPKEKAMYTIHSELFQAEFASKRQELVYHTDYHGVTTHPNPNPNPKHPKP